MRAGIWIFLMAVAGVSLLAAQAPNSGSQDQPKTDKAATADDTKSGQAEPVRGFSQRGAPPPGARGGFRGGTPGFQPGARGGFGSAPPTITTRTTEPGERSGLAQPRPMGPLPMDATNGKALLLDVSLAETTEALAQPLAAELLELERSGKLASNARVRLLMLENQPAFAQFGSLTNKVTGVTATNTRVLPIYQTVNVGTIVQATGRVADDGTILLQIYVEKSQVEPSDEPPETRKPEDITRLLAQSTVRLKAGEPVVLSSGPAGGSDGKSQNWIVVSCRAM